MKAKIVLQILGVLPLLSSLAVVQAQETQPLVKQSSISRLGGLTLGASSSDVAKKLGNPTAWLAPKDKTRSQIPPSRTQVLIPNALPDWANSASPSIDANHVAWFYKSDEKVVAIGLDRLGLVDAIVVVGFNPNNSSETLLESAQGNVNLGDSMKDVVSRFGFPDDVRPDSSNESAVKISTLYYDSPTAYNTTALTFRNNKVVRAFVFGDLHPKPSSHPK